MADRDLLQELQWESDPKRGEELGTQRLKAEPDSLLALSVLIPVKLKLGKLGECIDLCHKALSLVPDDVGLLANLGSALSQLGRSDESLGAYQKAIEIKPEDGETWNGYGVALLQAGKLSEAETALRRSIELGSPGPYAPINLSRVLVLMRRVDEALEVLREAALDQQGNFELLSAFVWPMLYSDKVSPEEILNHHRLVFRHLIPRERNSFFVNKSPHRKLRLAFLSGDYRDHSVMRLAKPLFEHLDRAEFEVICYSCSLVEDSVTQEIRDLCQKWRNVTLDSHSELRESLLKDKVDIAIDLSGHTLGGRLWDFATRLAPIQITMIGYPATTGVAAMDYRLVDDLTDPQEIAGRTISEKPLSLESPFMCFAPRHLDIPLKREATCLTFGSFSVLSKITPATLSLWARVLGQFPESRLLLKSQSFSDFAVKESLLSDLESRGVKRGRVDIHTHTTTYRDHLAMANKVDICLDTFPYHGTTTTLEFAQMGVPTVCLVGEIHHARVGLTINTSLGHPERAARNQDEFLAAVEGLVARLQEKKDEQANFLASPLCDGEGYAERFGLAIRQAWEEFCLSNR
ncbi:MAG: tetratricopeptide repeat protein [Fimbriimonadaceae bacterium]|jgi:predicted O-linked N-acetylglucosamine transferase (SPINDLY family)|nr:tetratricopeptide repeat protein [Fimbriimonadaceae bacterium]